LTEATLKIKVDASEVDKSARSLDALATSGSKAETASNKVAESTTRVSDAAKTAYTAITALAGSMVVSQVVAYADEWQNAENRLKLVTTSSQELSRVQGELLGLANNTRASFSSTAELYTTLTRSTTALGLSTEELLGITKTINQTFQVSGATTESYNNAIRQLGQGLAAGALRGDEFNSVAEQAPGIMDALAASLNMTRGELREFAATGGISAEILVTALQKYASTAEGMAAKSTRTFGQSLTEARNNALEFVGSSDAVKTSVGAAGTALVTLSENFETVGSVAGIAALAYTAKFIPSMVATVTATETLTTAATALRTAMTLLAGPVGIVAAAGVALLALVKHQEATADAAWAQAGAFDEVRAKLGSLTQQELAQNILKTSEQIQKTKENIAEQERLITIYGENSDGARASKEEIGRLSVELTAHTSNQASLRGQLDRVKEGFVATTTATEETHEATKEANVELLKMVSAYENSIKSVNLSTREKALFKAETEALSKGALPEEIEKIKELAGELYDLELAADSAAKAQKKAAEDAAKDWDNLVKELETLGEKQVRDQEKAAEDSAKAQEKAAEDIAEANKAAAERAAEEWMNFRNELSDIFKDTLFDGDGNFFQKIGDAFKDLLKQIAADLLASGIMQLLTGQGGFSLGGTLSGGGIAGQITQAAIGKFAPSLLGGGAAAGGSAALAGGAALAPGAGVLAMGNGGLALAGGGAGGGGIGAAVAGGLKAVGTGASNLIAAIPGWGWALGAAALAINQLDKSTPSHNAGMLIHDVPGAKADQKFDVPAFASGFDPVGFARRENQAAATQVIDVFRQDDAVLTELAKNAGYSVNFNASTFRPIGMSETGKGDGVFLGSAREDGGGSGATIASQRDAYVAAFVQGLSGQIGSAATSEILAAGSADAMINRAAELVAGKTNGSHANGLDYVPFDGYRATLHQGERVQTAAQARSDDTVMTRLLGVMESMRSELAVTAAATKRTADLLRRVTRDGDSLITEAA
jgi:tape measure domain-containing protein